MLGPGHPEQIARVSVVIENFKKLNNKYFMEKPTIITDEILKDTHDENYIELVKDSFFPTKGFSSLDGDTIISPEVKMQHLMQLDQLLQQ